MKYFFILLSLVLFPFNANARTLNFVTVKIQGKTLWWNKSDYNEINRFLNGKYRCIKKILSPENGILLSEIPSDDLNELKNLAQKYHLTVQTLKNHKTQGVTFRSWTSVGTELFNITQSETYITYGIAGFTSYGYPLYVIYINDTPPAEQHPLIRITGVHHGNEQLSGEIAISLIKELIKDENADIRKKYRFLIIPVVNPEGFIDNTRYTKDGYDLNRDYGMGWGSTDSDHPYSQPETKAIFRLALNYPPLLSFDYHTTETIVNTLRDYTSETFPEIQQILDLGGLYAQSTGYDLTIGADWYIAHGSSQDMLYELNGTFAYTIETPQTEINYETIITDNVSTLLSMLETIYENIYCAEIIDKNTGAPLIAKIQITPFNHPVYSGKDGVFCKIISGSLPQELSISLPNYKTAFISITNNDFNTANHVIELEPEDTPENPVFRVISFGNDSATQNFTVLSEYLLNEADNQYYELPADGFIKIDAGYTLAVTDSTEIQIILSPESEYAAYNIALSGSPFDFGNSFINETPLEGSAEINVNPEDVPNFRYIMIHSADDDYIKIDAVLIKGTVASVDRDSDGFTTDTDCNDNDDEVYPGNTEICDRKDNNCDGFIDENIFYVTDAGITCDKPDTTDATNNDVNDTTDTDDVDDTDNASDEPSCACSSSSSPYPPPFYFIFIMFFIFWKKHLFR